MGCLNPTNTHFKLVSQFLTILLKISDILELLESLFTTQSKTKIT